MKQIKEVDHAKFNAKLAGELEGMIKQPSWTLYIKTGTSRERPPEQKNWYYLRSAGVLRRIYLDGPVGVQRLRTYYGGSKNLGHQPAHFKRGSGKLLRAILQDLESAGLVEKAVKPKKGRILTKSGKKLMDGIAKSLK
jgi:small subunit ribosomal protein S19e